MSGDKREGQPDPRGWLGIGLRLLATLFFLLLLLALSRCGSPTPAPTVAPTEISAVAKLRVEVAPQGADIFIDGEYVGTTPLSVEGPAGRHTVRVQQGGYEPLEQTITLAAGDEATLGGELRPLPTEPPAQGSPTSTAEPLPSPAPSSTPIPTSPPPPPTETPTSPPPPPAVTLREGQVTIPTYPYADFITQAWSERFNMPYDVLDRAAYEAANPTPRDVTYRTLEVENEYLKLVFLPDVGGRLYEVIYKPTGHRETYRNPVLKPSPWGPPEQGWWLAAGGLEWCLPVEEHGYEWGRPWRISASHRFGSGTPQDERGVTVTLRDTAADVNDRLRAVIAVRLEAGAGHFTIKPRLENPTGAPLKVKYWTNALLAPGGRNAPSAELRFVLPEAVTEVTVHSRGDDFLPGSNERMSWPLYPVGGSDAVDYSRLGNWNRWLGFFEDPAPDEPGSSQRASFMAVYDESYDEGMVRAFPVGLAPGAKGFAFGWGDPIPASNWTGDGSSYVELHGGPAPTFDDAVTISAGGSLEWTETWYPIAGLGGLRYANRAAALNLSTGGGQAHIGVAVTRPWSGEIVLELNDRPLWSQSVSLLPGQPFRAAAPLGPDAPASGRLSLLLRDAEGDILAAYRADFTLK